MGIMPVAPRSNRLLLPGDRKSSGFMDNPVEVGLMTTDRMNMAALR
jgi:hypothetical protein